MKRSLKIVKLGDNKSQYSEKKSQKFKFRWGKVTILWKTSHKNVNLSDKKSQTSIKKTKVQV